MKIAFLFPGQGAQKVGMGRDFYDRFPVAKHLFEEADEALGCHFSRLIFEGPFPELTLTKNSQIALYVTCMALSRTLEHQFPHIKPALCAGLSLGEYTALATAGVFSFIEGLQLVKVRAEAMHAACEEVQGSMQVVLGLSEEEVNRALGTLAPHPIWVANLNCPGQVVISGSLEALSLAGEPLKIAGAKRVLPLDVSGAFHSALMRSAQEALRLKIEATPFKDSPLSVVMNVPGAAVSTTEEMKQRLIEQVVSPVRWEKGILAAEREGIETYIEIGPGKTLAGMNKRIGVAHPTLSIETVADLEVLCSC